MALAVPADCAKLLRERARAMRLPASWRLRCLSPEHYHITLAFLGDTDDSRLPLIESLARQALADQAPFDCEFAAIDFFPGRSQPRLVAALPSSSPVLMAMQRKLAMAFAEAGCRRERRPFRPHATLVRLPSNGLLPLAPCVSLAGESLSFRVDAVKIFESRRCDSGPFYGELATIRLRAT